MERREPLRKVEGLRREVGGAGERGLGFLGGEAPGPHHRLTVGSLQLKTLVRSCRVTCPLP